MGGIGFKELLLIAVIVVLVFGSKRLGSLGGDIASFVKGLRSGLKDAPDDPAARPTIDDKSHAGEPERRNDQRKTPV
jgi:sec-independent protein translocase protein TatA